MLVLLFLVLQSFTYLPGYLAVAGATGKPNKHAKIAFILLYQFFFFSQKSL